MVVIDLSPVVNSFTRREDPKDVKSSEDSTEERLGGNPEDSSFPAAAPEADLSPTARVPSHDGQADPVMIDLSLAESEESYHTATVPPESPSPAGARGSRPPLSTEQEAVREQFDRRQRGGSEEDSSSAQRGLSLMNDILSPVASQKSLQSSEQISPGLADRLVQVYLSNEYANLPILDLSELRSSYDAIRMGKNTAAGSSPFHGLLITIFSLAGLSCPDVGETDLPALFEHSQTVSRNFDSRSTPAERAQSYILQAQYLYASGNPRAALISIGFATRIAQVLALEARTQDQNPRHSRSQELNRRIYHGAVLLERMIAFQLRLPAEASRASRVPMPVHMDTDNVQAISADVSAEKESASIIDFLSACARLYEHVGAILTWEEETRMRKGSCAAKKLLSLCTTSFFRLDAVLHQWQQSLPSSLQDPGIDTRSAHPIVRRQRCILRARYLYIRLRLYRPLLLLGLAACDKCSCQTADNPHFKLEGSSPDCPLVLSVVRASSLKCIASALEIVDLCERRQKLLRPSWETLDYLYVCGTVFLAAQSCPSILGGSHGHPGPEEMELSLGRVLILLERYQILHPSDRIYKIAQRCRRTLESISGIIEGSDEAAVFDEDRSPQLLERMRMGSPVDNELNEPSDSSRLALFGWLGSLPDDLAGDL